MIDVQNYITRGALSGLFLYSTPERISTEGSLHGWQNAKDERVSLVTA
jgi:hypothetical protein